MTHVPKEERKWDKKGKNIFVIGYTGILGYIILFRRFLQYQETFRHGKEK